MRHLLWWLGGGLVAALLWTLVIRQALEAR
jgi:hypothetical protein